MGFCIFIRVIHGSCAQGHRYSSLQHGFQPFPAGFTDLLFGVGELWVNHSFVLFLVRHMLNSLCQVSFSWNGSFFSRRLHGWGSDAVLEKWRWVFEYRWQNLSLSVPHTEVSHYLSAGFLQQHRYWGIICQVDLFQVVWPQDGFGHLSHTWKCMNAITLNIKASGIWLQAYDAFLRTNFNSLSWFYSDI